MKLKLGLMFANTGRFATSAAAARALGQAAEDAGIESLWTVEHVVVPQGYQSEYPYDRSGRMPGGEDSPIPDPLIWLSHLSAVTTTVKLATGILILPQRNPLVLAKACSTLDQLSGGRLILGVGVGWLREEFDALGIPFSGRGRRLDEYVAALRSAWGEQPASFSGEHVSFDDVYSVPRPADGTIPIVVGGHTDAAARRAGRLGDGFFPGRASDSALVRLLGIMREAAEEAGRDPGAIEVTAGSPGLFGLDPQGAAARLEELGVHRVVIPPLSYDPAQIGTALAELTARLA
ncbi:MAG: LLM class F420-dependent oxidoreductase [Acidimicrobiales bacterium]